MELIDGYNKDNKPTGHIVERSLIKDCGKGQFHVGF